MGLVVYVGQAKCYVVAWKNHNGNGKLSKQFIIEKLTTTDCFPISAKSCKSWKNTSLKLFMWHLFVILSVILLLL